MPINHFFKRLAKFFLQIAEGNFHRSTRIVGFGSGSPPEGSCWYPVVEYSKLGELAQPVDGAECCVSETLPENSETNGQSNRRGGDNDDGRGGD
jgi:hypothetical protein